MAWRKVNIFTAISDNHCCYNNNSITTDSSLEEHHNSISIIAISVAIAFNYRNSQINLVIHSMQKNLQHKQVHRCFIHFCQYILKSLKNVDSSVHENFSATNSAFARLEEPHTYRSTYRINVMNQAYVIYLTSDEHVNSSYNITTLSSRTRTKKLFVPRVVTQRFSSPLRDDPNKGCEGNRLFRCIAKLFVREDLDSILSNSISIFSLNYVTKRLLWFQTLPFSVTIVSDR